MRVGRPVRESNLEGIMEEKARVMRVRMVGEFDGVFSGFAAWFLEESWLIFCDVRVLVVVGTVVSLGVNSELPMGSVVGSGETK